MIWQHGLQSIKRDGWTGWGIPLLSGLLEHLRIGGVFPNVDSITYRVSQKNVLLKILRAMTAGRNFGPFWAIHVLFEGLGRGPLWAIFLAPGKRML